MEACARSNRKEIHEKKGCVMAYEPKDLTFSLFPNKDRKTDKHPNLAGTAIINGVSYFIDGWTNTDRNGNKYIAGKLKPKQERAAEIRRDEPRREQETSSYGTPLDDEIPFAPEFR